MTAMIGIGLIGHGYWGPNLLRNFMEVSGARVVTVSDLRPDRLERVRSRYPGIEVTSNHREVIERTDVDAICIATPISTHFQLALEALQAGKHVLVEKPLAATSEQVIRLIEEAKRRNRVLMVGHTFVYSPAVRKIKELLTAGHLGDLYYYDSVRINLGLFQNDVNVIWDLAVHDLSIMEFVLQARPTGVMATGLNHFPGHPENIAYLTVLYDQPLVAHIHVNWLAPVKIRRTLIGGSKKMIVYDDLEPSEKVKIYESGVTLNNDPNNDYELRVGYRTGDMWAPQLSRTEPLQVEASHFVECISSNQAPVTGGEVGLRVVQLLEAASDSLSNMGRFVELKRS